nr:MAG: hypothetical protein [Sanya fiers-like virus 29]
MRLYRASIVKSVSFVNNERTVHTYIEIFTIGWKTGSKTRIRKLKTVYALYVYLNKVFRGGYMTDQEYSDAWDMALSIESDPERCVPIGFEE